MSCIFSRSVAMLFLLFGLGGCITLESGDVTVGNLSNVEKGKREVTFLNNTPYMADMSLALAKHGFVIKAMPSQQQVIELQGKDRVAKYQEAATRWGIAIQTKHIGDCIFTPAHMYAWTLTLTDITNNQVAMVVKQEAPDGPCTTMEPVFDTLAKAVADNW